MSLRNIVLIGFSYTGKSSVARLVAQRLGWRFVDTDQRIQALAGATIPEIFASGGEPRFRALERQALSMACSIGESVISTGGGAVIEAGNRMLMAGSGVVVLLETKPQTIHQRLLADSTSGEPEVRPLLQGDDPLNKIKAIKEQRQPLYSATAHWTVHTDNLSVEEVADEVLRAWGRLGPRLEATDRPEDPDPDDPHAAIAARLRTGAIAVVATASGACPIFVHPGAMNLLGKRMTEAGLSGRAFIITDSNVNGYYGARVAEVLGDSGFQTETFAIDAGEGSKSLRGAESIYDWLIERRAERGNAIVALGGGVVGDLAGYVAATYTRGMPLVQVPTSLLAMVDASIGGKVAVNVPQAKNLIGAFYQPRLIVADTKALETLPVRELTEGWAEVIKHALILDSQLLDHLEREVDKLTALEPRITAELVGRSAAIKASVVSQDERETGLRTILNYGHTIGHALETATGYEGLLHGEGVSIGMMGAARISQRMGLLSDDVVERQRVILESYGLPIRCPGVEINDLLDAMALDKKVRDKAIRWVLLEDVGATVVRDDVPESLVREVLEELSG